MLNMPPVVKNLILANVVFFLITIVLKQSGTDLYPILGLHERAASTHQRHDKLGNSNEQIEILEGFGEMLRQLAYAS